MRGVVSDGHPYRNPERRARSGVEGGAEPPPPQNQRTLAERYPHKTARRPLIAIMLLKWLHHLSKAKWSLSNLASMLRLNLFTYRDLGRWLDNPFGTPPLIPQPAQLTLDLG